MKKISMTIMMVLAVILAGCNASDNGDSGKGDVNKVEKAGEEVKEEKVKEEKVEKEIEQPLEETDVSENISLQLLKADEEAGATLENNQMYIELNEMLQEGVELGIADDFSIEVIDIVDSGTEDASLVFLAINRTTMPLKNISFDYTLGHENGEFVWQDVEVNLTEEDAGIIQPNHAIPYSLGITAEQEALIDLIDADNKVMEMKNPKIEVVE